MDVLSQSEIDALLRKMLSDPSVLPDNGNDGKTDSNSNKSAEKPHVTI